MPPDPIDLTSDLTAEDITGLKKAINDNTWIFSQEGVKLNLTTEDKLRVQGKFDNGWLNDTIIHAVHSLLRQNYPNLS